MEVGINKTKSFDAFAILLCCYLCKDSIVDYLYVIVNKATGSEFIGATVISGLMLLVVFAAYCKKDWVYVRPFDFVVPLFVLFGFLFTIAVYPQNIPYMAYNFRRHIAWCIPAFFVGLCTIEMNDSLFKNAVLASKIAIVIGFVYGIYKGTSGQISNDEMGLAYSILINTMLVEGYYFYSKRTDKMCLLFSIIGIAYTFILGTRGPIILNIVFIIISLWLTSKIKIGYKIIIAVIATGFIMIIYNSDIYLNVLRFLRDIVAQTGFSTRVIDSLIHNRMISYMSGRDLIYERLSELLKLKPYFGYGLFGEWPYIGWNAHNLYREVVFEYGFVIGIPLIVLYTTKIAVVFLNEKDMINKLFLLILIVFVLGQGFFGYSHLRPELFFLLGFALKQRRIQKHARNKEPQIIL